MSLPTAQNWLADNVRPSLTAQEQVEAFQRAVREGRRTGTLREVRFTVPPCIGFTHTLNDPEFRRSPLLDVCRQLDATAEGVECFRIAPGEWEYFFNARQAGPYVERPLLGF